MNEAFSMNLASRTAVLPSFPATFHFHDAEDVYLAKFESYRDLCMNEVLGYE